MTLWEVEERSTAGAVRQVAEMATDHQRFTCLPRVPAPSQLRRNTGRVLANGLQGFAVTWGGGFKSLCMSFQFCLPLKPCVEMARLREQSSLVC